MRTAGVGLQVGRGLCPLVSLPGLPQLPDPHAMPLIEDIVNASGPGAWVAVQFAPEWCVALDAVT